MSHKLNDHDKNNYDKEAHSSEVNERRIDQLIDVVEKHTRTERHLEQHSDIASLDQIKHTIEVQKDREEEIDHLKAIISHGKTSTVDDMDCLQKNYEYTNKYVEDNQDHMDSSTLENTMQKQENRKEQIANKLKR